MKTVKSYINYKENKMDRGKFYRNIRIVLIGLWLVAWGSTVQAADKKDAPKDGPAVMN